VLLHHPPRDCARTAGFWKGLRPLRVESARSHLPLSGHSIRVELPFSNQNPSRSAIRYIADVVRLALQRRHWPTSSQSPRRSQTIALNFGHPLRRQLSGRLLPPGQTSLRNCHRPSRLG
jgi:hypothetical protein